MPFNDNLPAENTDPWYAPLTTAWSNLKSFVNGLEVTLSGKADTSALGTAAAKDVGDFATPAQGAAADSAVQPGDLAPVATSGAYDDLTGAPAIPDSPDDIGAATAAQGAKADTAVQPDNPRLAIIMTQTAYAALDPKVPGQLYVTTEG